MFRIKVLFHALRAALWASFFGWFALLFVGLTFLLPTYYDRKEPVFISPIFTQTPKVRLRNDSMGKGHFNATRGANSRRRHEGIDILAPIGTPILAPKTGRVIFSGINRGYGEYVRIWHPNGWSTAYGHLSEIHVKQGEWVKQGRVIGLVGKTGNANSKVIRPHLHFEIRDPYRPVDPMPLIKTQGGSTDA